ncbi:MAG: multifunctional CCA addition/repair protein [Pseudohongiellaceae bacterium]
METYLVGGAVRDSLLGLGQSDRDWVVVGATQQEMETAGFRPVGRDFPVFLHPDSGEEYALARTERNTAPGYRGFAVNASPDVTLEEDLQRRDLTINAMAQAPDGTVVDPWGGQQDLEQRLLRHVSPAFVEDPLRVLRVARFAARFAPLGFRVADETQHLMRRMVDDGELEHLVPERVWQETDRALGEADPAVYLRVLRDCGALAVILPEVDRLFGVPQPEAHHPEIDTGEHILLCLQQAAVLSKETSVRFAVLMHDVGKGLTPEDNWPRHYGHESIGVPAIEALCERLRVPNEHRALAVMSARYHTHCHRMPDMKPATVVKLLEQLDVFRRPERFERFLLASEADARGRTGYEQRPYPQADWLRRCHHAAAGVDQRQVIDGLPEGRRKGEAIREAIRRARQTAVSEVLTAIRAQRDRAATEGEHRHG